MSMKIDAHRVVTRYGNYFRFRLQASPPSPTRPEPRSNSVDGSGL